MKTTINLDGAALELSANAATPFRYKMTFGQDLLIVLANIKAEDETLGADISDTVSRLTYIMNKQALNKANELSDEDFLTWLEQIDDPMAFITHAKDIIEFYMKNVKTASKSKNAKGPSTGK